MFIPGEGFNLEPCLVEFPPERPSPLGRDRAAHRQKWRRRRRQRGQQRKLQCSSLNYVLKVIWINYVTWLTDEHSGKNCLANAATRKPVISLGQILFVSERHQWAAVVIANTPTTCTKIRSGRETAQNNVTWTHSVMCVRVRSSAAQRRAVKRWFFVIRNISKKDYSLLWTKSWKSNWFNFKPTVNRTLIAVKWKCICSAVMQPFRRFDYLLDICSAVFIFPQKVFL